MYSRYTLIILLHIDMEVQAQNHMSIYGKSYGGGMCWGHDIIPMTEKEAKVWAEAHLTADEYIELFDIEE